MGKLLKILFGLLAAVVLLVVAAIVIIPLVVDPNDFRDDIVKQVKENTGRDLIIEDDIGLSVFPWLGVELGGLSLSQPEGFGDEPFAQVKKAQIRAKIMPLLQQHLEVDTITLDGLQLSLIRHEKGIGNWEDLAQAKEAEETEDDADDGQGAPLKRLAIGGIQISDSRLSWDDRQGGQKITVDDIQLNTGEIVPGQPLDVELGFAVNSSAPAIQGRLDLAGKVTPENNNQLLKITPFKLNLSVRGDDDLKADVSLSADALLDLAAQNYQLKGLHIESQTDGKQIPGGSLSSTLDADATVDLSKDTLELAGLKLQAAGLDLSGNLNGSAISSEGSYSGSLALAPFNLRDLLQRLGMEAPETADAETLKKVALSADLHATVKQAGLQNLKITLDQSVLSGKGRILLNSTPGYRFALALDSIDLDRYLPPPADKPAAKADTPAAAKAADDAPLFPVEQLRQLDIDGSFKVGTLKVKKLTLQNAEIGVKAKDGDVKINQKVGKFYQGSLGGKLGVNVKGKTPKITINQHAKGIQAEPLLDDLTEKARLAGSGNFNLDVSGRGNSTKAIKKSLDGTMNFVFANGAVKGINLGRMLREASAKLKGQTLPPDQEADETDFSELKASAVIKKGVLKNDDLSAKSPLFRLTGKGTVDIGNDTLDYKIKPVLVGTSKGQGGRELEELQGVPIPVHLTGPISKPDWKVDLAEALTAKQKTKLKKKLDEKLDEVAPGLKDQLPSGLKGLFN